MVQRRPTTSGRLSARGQLQLLMRAGLRVIPLDRGAKTTHEPGWAQRGESTIDGLLPRAAALWRIDAGELNELLDAPSQAWDEAVATGAGLNLGVLHAASGTVCLDLDHAQALDALQAGVVAVGGPAGYIPESSLAWTSPRGRKWLWQVPKPLSGRSVKLLARRRSSSGEVTVETVLELRASGQDMIPPGWRSDVERGVRWDTPPGELRPLPDVLRQLMVALAEGDPHVVHAMQAAIGVPADLRGIDATHVDDYPSRLAACAHERKLVNANLDVADLLAAHGYVRHGKRWGSPASRHADGITMPASGRDRWHCWHEGDVLAGQFDAWRAFVDLTHGGELAAARADARERFQAPLAIARGASKSVSEPETRTVLNGISDGENLLQDSKVSPDERAPGSPRTASGGPARLEATNPPPTPQRGATRVLPGKAPGRPAKAAEGGSGRVVAGEGRRGPQGAIAAVQEADEPTDLYDLDALLAGESKPVVLALDGKVRVPVGTYLLAGAPKAGKSWLAMGLSLVMTGRVDEVLGMRAVQPSDGLYVLVDDATVDRVRKRAAALMGDGHGSAGCTWTAATQWPPRGYAHLGRVEALDEWLGDHPTVRHVVIDTLVAWRADVERDRSVVQQEYEEVRNLQEVARSRGITLLIVHYTNKGGSARNFDWDDPFTSIAGTTALQGGADGMFALHRCSTQVDEQHGALWFTCRDLEAQEAAGELAVPSGRWTWLAASADAVKTMDARRAIVELLVDTPINDWPSAQQIHAAINSALTEQTRIEALRRTLNRMCHEGILESRRGPSGGYRLTSRARTEMAMSRKF